MKKQALITGATSGIGKAYAVALAKRGYNLILTGRRKDVIEAVANDLMQRFNIQVTVCLVDFANKAQREKFLAYVQEVKHIDFLVNNAGYGAELAFTEDSLAQQQAMLDVHNTTSIALCHVVARKMKQQRKGVIINVSSLAGFLYLPHSAMYCATKAFLTTFTRSLALELKPYGIDVQALCPGFVHTDFHDKLAIDKNTCKNKGPIKWMHTKDVVAYSLKHLTKEGHVVCIPGGWNKVGYQLLKVVPQKLYFAVVSKTPPKLK
ncbi:MAG: SDR family NAD(P)-dependent oxidoreductase [Cellulosilyticaceae bacterium]